LLQEQGFLHLQHQQQSLPMPLQLVVMQKQLPKREKSCREQPGEIIQQFQLYFYFILFLRRTPKTSKK
jgi:hypothetical protein